MGKNVCINCNKEKEIALYGKSKGLCHVCYKKLLWKPKLVICKRCKREKPMHAKGFCVGCYNSLFHIEKVREHNLKRYHNLDPETYKKITKECQSCGFSKMVDLHHLDHNNKNNSFTNLIGLCPNCHKMIHSKKYQSEIFEILMRKGYTIPEGYETDGFFGKNSLKK